MPTTLTDPKTGGSLPPGVERTLRDLRARVRRIALVRGVALTGGLFLAVLAVGIFLDRYFFLSEGFRSALLGLALLGPAIAALFALLAPLLRKRGDEELAMGIEASHPEIGERFASTVELERSLDPESIKGSPQLIRALVLETEARIPQVDLRRAAPDAKARRSTLVLAVLFIGLAGYGLYSTGNFLLLLRRFFGPHQNLAKASSASITVDPGRDATVARGDPFPIGATIKGTDPAGAFVVYREDGGSWERVPMERSGPGDFHVTFKGLKAPIAYKVRAGDGETRLFRAEVVLRPTVERFRIEYSYPAYTGLRPWQVETTDGNLTAVKGTLARVRATASRDLLQAEVVSGKEGAATIPARVEGGRDVVFELPLVETGSYRVVVRDALEMSNSEDPVHSIQVLPDRPPELSVILPGKEVRLPPSDRVPIRLSGKDDFGIAKAELLIQAPPGGEARAPIELEVRGPRDGAVIEGVLDLGLLKAKPGETFVVKASASDGASPPNSAVSEEIRIVVAEGIAPFAAAEKLRRYEKIEGFLARALSPLERSERPGRVEIEGALAPLRELPAFLKETAAALKGDGEAERDVENLAYWTSEIAEGSLAPLLSDAAAEKAQAARSELQAFAENFRRIDASERMEAAGHDLKNVRAAAESSRDRLRLRQAAPELSGPVNGNGAEAVRSPFESAEGFLDQIAGLRPAYRDEIKRLAGRISDGLAPGLEKAGVEAKADRPAAAVAHVESVLSEMAPVEAEAGRLKDLLEREAALARLALSARKKADDPLARRADEIEALAKQQQDLASKIKEADRKGDVEESKKLAEEQARILNELKKLAEEIAKEGSAKERLEDLARKQAELKELVEQARAEIEKRLKEIAEAQKGLARETEEAGKKLDGKPGESVGKEIPEEMRKAAAEIEAGKPASALPLQDTAAKALRKEGQEIAQGDGQPGEKEPPGEKPPGEGEPPEKQPGEKQPGEGEPGEKKPGEGQPGEKQPGEGQPGEKQPGEKQPGEKQPGEGQPGEKQPGEGQPGEKQPGEKQPGEKQPGEGQPGEKQPGEGQPGEKQPGEGQPGERQPGEGQPGEKQPGEGKPGEKQPGEGQPGEKQPGEGQPGEKQPGEGQPGEKTPGQTPGESQKKSAAMSGLAEKQEALARQLSQTLEGEKQIAAAAAGAQKALEAEARALTEVASASGQPSPGQPGEQPPGQGQPGEGQPGQGQPGQGQPGEGQPGQGQPGQGQPGEGQPGQGQPGEGQPGQGQPGEGQPGQGQPGQGQPGQGQPGQGQPGQGQPGQGQPGQGQPGQGQPGLMGQAAEAMGGAAQQLGGPSPNLGAASNLMGQAQSLLGQAAQAGAGQPGAAVPGSLSQAQGAMGQAMEGLSSGNAGASTQAAASSAASSLAQAASAAKGGPGSSQSPPGEVHGAPQTVSGEGDGGGTKLAQKTFSGKLQDLLDQAGSGEFDRLPAEVKENLLQAAKEDYPAEYEDLIRAYFKRLASGKR